MLVLSKWNIMVLTISRLHEGSLHTFTFYEEDLEHFEAKLVFHWHWFTQVWPLVEAVLKIYFESYDRKVSWWEGKKNEVHFDIINLSLTIKEAKNLGFTTVIKWRLSSAASKIHQRLINKRRNFFTHYSVLNLNFLLNWSSTASMGGQSKLTRNHTIALLWPPISMIIWHRNFCYKHA